MTALPIDEVLADIRAALMGGNRLVLAAPPGAGKTTKVPLDLLRADWLGPRKILLLEPRRIAARMAAQRMAALLGEKVGETVGLSTRVERRVSSATRLEVITDGLFLRRVLADPELSAVGAVLFDEFHERSLNLDAGLAFAVDVQSALRPDLRLALMSATLDVGRVATAFGAAAIESAGRAFPVETIYLGRGEGPVHDQAAKAVRRALAEQEGSILVFLPGRAEILRTAERLVGLPEHVLVAPLYGAMAPGEQDAAVSPPPKGARKVVLATDIAESALTIEDVRVVIDAGLARIATQDGQGGTFLETRRAARANVDQRRGRAGRLGPGVCYRLWDEAATRGLAAAPTPEIALGDLSGLVLAAAEWGVADLRRLFWVDPPSEGRLAAARAELVALGAVDRAGAVTPLGRRIADLPLAPRLAALIAAADTPSEAALGAEIAALASERGVGGDGVDIRTRIERFRRDRSERARALKAQAARWSGGAEPASTEAAGPVIAAAMPAQIARRRDKAGQLYLLASGRAAGLDAAEPLAAQDWLAVLETTGAAGAGRILAAAPLDEKEALRWGGVTEAEETRYDAATKTIRSRRVRRMGAIVLSETPLPKPDAGAARAALVVALAEQGLALLPAADAVRAFLARLRLAREVAPELPALTEPDILARGEDWLGPLLGADPSLDRPHAEDVRRALEGLLDYDERRRFETLAPRSWRAPAGRDLEIDYLAEGTPRVEARVQEFYGAARHPSILGGALPLAVSLLSPARAQVALTKDLPGFWAGGYRDMAKDMRGRYPKHDWPDDPATARAHAGKTKARLKADK